MATVREGNRIVLVVVDVQVGVVRTAWQVDRVVANVARAVERARRAGVPVLWVQHAADDLVEGSADWQWVSALRPGDDEPRVHKRFESAFEQTTLEETLTRLGATHIALAGASTNWCIRATAYAALERGYDLTLIRDAHTTSSMDLDDGARIDGAQCVADLNLVMTLIGYPGRQSATADAEAIDFALAAA